jgi:hypothetical protein
MSSFSLARDLLTPKIAVTVVWVNCVEQRMGVGTFMAQVSV